MKNHYTDTAEQILKFRQNRDPNIHKMVITLIPTLAVYDTDTFTEQYLHSSMDYLMLQLGSIGDKAIGILIIVHSQCCICSQLTFVQL